MAETGIEERREQALDLVTGELMERYSAVVETGSCSMDYRRWEERRNCGHAHRTIEAAPSCSEKLYHARYIRGSWQASAAWHGYTVHNQHGERVMR